MKKVLVTLAICMFITPYLHAQVDVTINHRPDWYERRKLIISGMVIGAVGCGAAMYGALDYAANSDNVNASYRRTDLAVAGVGVGLFAIGGGLVYLGLSKGVTVRWSVITPRRNEIGFAYNF